MRASTVISCVLALVLLPCACIPPTPANELPAPSPTHLLESPATPVEPAQSTTYCVHPNEASPEQCTGLVNAPYPGSGTDQPCAWDHPFRALPPGGSPRIAGGDRLIVAAGNYRMGYGAPRAEAYE